MNTDNFQPRDYKLSIDADIINKDDLPPCKHCGELISEHAQDNDPPYACLGDYIYTVMREPSYGGFYGGDPRNFHPDHEACSAKEIEAHRQACIAADRAYKEYALRSGGCVPNQYVLPELNLQCDSCQHRTFGLGVTTYPFEQTYYEPIESPQEFNAKQKMLILKASDIIEREELE